MALDPEDLIDIDRRLLDPRVYTDLALYELELKHIFGRC